MEDPNQENLTAVHLEQEAQAEVLVPLISHEARLFQMPMPYTGEQKYDRDGFPIIRHRDAMKGMLKIMPGMNFLPRDKVLACAEGLNTQGRLRALTSVDELQEHEAKSLAAKTSTRRVLKMWLVVEERPAVIMAIQTRMSSIKNGAGVGDSEEA